MKIQSLYDLYAFMEDELDKIQHFLDNAGDKDDDADWQIEYSKKYSYEKLKGIEDYVITDCQKFSIESIDSFFQSCLEKTRNKLKLAYRCSWNEWDEQEYKYIVLSNLFINVFNVLKKKVYNYEFMLFGGVK